MDVKDLTEPLGRFYIAGLIDSEGHHPPPQAPPRKPRVGLVEHLPDNMLLSFGIIRALQ